MLAFRIPIKLLQFECNNFYNYLKYISFALFTFNTNHIPLFSIKWFFFCYFFWYFSWFSCFYEGKVISCLGILFIFFLISFFFLLFVFQFLYFISYSVLPFFIAIFTKALFLFMVFTWVFPFICFCFIFCFLFGICLMSSYTVGRDFVLFSYFGHYLYLIILLFFTSVTCYIRIHVGKQWNVFLINIRKDTKEKLKSYFTES